MNKKFNLVLEESFLKDLISKGLSIFDYQNNSLYYETSNSKVKADIQVTEEEVVSLTNKLSILHGKEFNNLNPYISINNSEFILVATSKPSTKNVCFYLNIKNM